MAADTDIFPKNAYQQLMNFELGTLYNQWTITYKDVLDHKYGTWAGKTWKWLSKGITLKEFEIAGLFEHLSPSRREELNKLADQVVKPYFQQGHSTGDAEAVETAQRICSLMGYSKRTAIAWLGESYISKERIWNNDRSLVNQQSQTLAVFDGAGHNKKSVFDREHSVYSALAKAVWNHYGEHNSYKTPADAVAAMADILQKGAATMRQKLDEDEARRIRGQGPALLIGQVVEVAGVKQLAIAQSADCCCVIKHTDGSFTWKTAAPDLGLGDGGVRGIHRGEFHLLQVNPGDEVIAFSDGIGEFLSQAEMEKILKDQPPHLLGDAFREAIMTHPERQEFKCNEGLEGGYSKERNMAAHPGKKCKVHSDILAAKSYYDDMSLAYLQVC